MTLSKSGTCFELNRFHKKLTWKAFEMCWVQKHTDWNWLKLLQKEENDQIELLEMAIIAAIKPIGKHIQSSFHSPINWTTIIKNKKHEHGENVEWREWSDRANTKVDAIITAIKPIGNHKIIISFSTFKSNTSLKTINHQ